MFSRNFSTFNHLGQATRTDLLTDVSNVKVPSFNLLVFFVSLSLLFRFFFFFFLLITRSTPSLGSFVNSLKSVKASKQSFDEVFAFTVTMLASNAKRTDPASGNPSSSVIDIYRGIYILPNILSPGKWPRARAKLLNIQGGNEAKFVCVSIGSGH